MPWLRRFNRSEYCVIVQELAPGERVTFDEDSAFIRFRVVDDALGITLIESSGEWLPSILAKNSDEEIKIFIHAVNDGKI